MSHVDAIFEGGVFRPLQEVDLPDKQRVVLSVAPAVGVAPLQWLEHARKLRAEMLRRRGPLGPLPDSTPLIREDRNR